MKGHIKPADRVTQQAHPGWRRGEGGRPGYAPYYATPERNPWLDTDTGSLPPTKSRAEGAAGDRSEERGFPATAPFSFRTRAAAAAYVYMAAYFYGHYNLGT